jgi:AcrR family transcriptional regulator
MAEAGLRERHTARTRAAIVAAAIELFEERGFSNTTIDEIAARADIAPRTFFRYFPTKEAVLFAESADQRRRVLEALAARPADEHPLVSLVAVRGAFAEDISVRSKDIALRQQVAAENPGVYAYERMMLEAEMAQALAAFVADRLGPSPPSDERPQVWAALVMTTFRIAYHQWLGSGRKGRLRTVFERALGAAAEAADLLPTRP